jgi:hypothetical protein
MTVNELRGHDSWRFWRSHNGLATNGAILVATRDKCEAVMSPAVYATCRRYMRTPLLDEMQIVDEHGNSAFLAGADGIVSRYNTRYLRPFGRARYYRTAITCPSGFADECAIAIVVRGNRRAVLMPLLPLRPGSMDP